MDAPRFEGSDGGTSPQTCSTAEWNTTPQEQEAHCPSHDPDRRDGHTAIGHSPDVRVAVTKIQAQISRSVLPVNGGAEPLTPVLVSQHNKAAKQRDDATICTVTSAPPPLSEPSHSRKFSQKFHDFFNTVVLKVRSLGR